MKRTILVHGMHGLGDNIHQRAVIRQLLARRYCIYLDTPWPCVYHDLVGADLVLVRTVTRLRTQAKNAEREADKLRALPNNFKTDESMVVTYRPAVVQQSPSVLAAMLKSTECDLASADFRMPIPPQWATAADKLIATWGAKKPIMLYRPLNERTEWGGCAARNPDHRAYAKLFRSIRDRFFVVSVADFEDGKEWMVGENVKADIEYHRGELQFPVLAALTKRAACVFTSPGFLVILGQAVGTPGVVVFGGYENSKSFSGGAKLAPYLGIDPIEPCQCFSHNHACRKAIDLVKATRQLGKFTDDITKSKNRAGGDRLGQHASPIYESGRA